MTHTKSTRSALLMSVLSLVLCCSMLIGTTFAWFTDSVTSANNVIQSGNLDIKLEYWDGDSWEDVEGKADVLTNSLWEPGVTEVAYLKLTNAGTLALKYQLGINILSETAGVNKLEESFKLSDYIQFGVVEGVNGETGKYATREAAVAAVTDAKKISAGYSKADSLAAGADPVYLALVVYMPTTVGNEANHDGVTLPKIELGINVFATQVANEEDSFGADYDAGAPWTGAIDVDWYAENPDATEFVINTPEQLAGLAAIVNGTAAVEATTYSTESTTVTLMDSFQGKTVKLSGNVDLNGLQWTPIGDVDADDYVGFRGTFDGQEHTIYNLSIEKESWGQGLFGYLQNRGAVIENFTVCNASVKAVDTSAVIAGYATYGTFSNVHVSGKLTVEGGEHMGGIVGNGYYANFENCSVIADGSIVATTGSFVGGIVGYHSEGKLSIKNCTVKNVKITGFAAVGGITGIASASNIIDSCTVENVVLTKTRDGGHPAIGSIAGCYSYNPSHSVTITNCSTSNVTLEGNYEGVPANVLCGSEYSGQTNSSFVLDGTSTDGVVSNLEKLVPVVQAPTAEALLEALENVTGPVVIEATGVSVAITGSEHFNIPSDVTLKGLTINAQYRGGNYIFCGDNVVLEDCSFGNSDRNTILAGSADSTNVTVNNCTFSGPTLINFHDNQDGVITLNNCTFTGSKRYDFVEAMGGTHYFNNCTFDFTGVAQNSMGVLKAGCFNVYSEADYEKTVAILTGCKLINCGRHTYGPKSTLTVK